MQYKEFLRQKEFTNELSGFDVDRNDLHEILFDFQKDIVKWSLKKGKAAIFAGTGLGKCHGKGTEVITYDGTVRKVENIKVGDRLMGPNSKPREVLSLARGKDKMYKITPRKGEPFICNEPHVLSLKMSVAYRGFKKDEVVNIPLNEYMKESNKFKHIAKLWRTGVDFPHKDLCQDPYVMGIWIGDGHVNAPDITTGDKDGEVISYLTDWSEKVGLKMNEKSRSGKSTTRSFVVSKINNQWNKNHFRDSIKKFIINGEKRIPQEYLLNSTENRLQLLAGLIDSDGYHNDNCYEILTKYKGLSDDILYLARSLGFGTTHKEVEKGIKEIGFKSKYQKIAIYGHTDVIPCKVKRKQASPRRQKKNVLRTGFKVEYLGIDDYYGFEISGDHLYLLKDFTVTHNTLMQLEWARQVHERTGNNVLILAPLAVASQTVREADEKMNLSVTHIRQDKKVTDGINITNYEQLHNVDLTNIGAIVLDESSILKNFTGKVRNQIIDSFIDTPYKLACTATPAPNDHMELGNHSDFAGVMNGHEMLSMFFINDFKEKQWRLKGHAEANFWEWVASWAVMITKPSDLGYDDGAYDLPPLNMYEVIVEGKAKEDELVPTYAQTLSERRRARRDSIEERVKKAADLVNSTDEQFLIWCDLNDESKMLTNAIDGAVEVKGADSAKHKEESMLGFADGTVKKMVTKPQIAGHGMNWQSCRNMVFVGLSDSFEQVFQAIRRCWRFGQEREVNVYIVISEQEGAVLTNIKRKEKEFDRMVNGMIKYTMNINKKDIEATTKDVMQYAANEKLILPNFLKENEYVSN